MDSKSRIREPSKPSQFLLFIFYKEPVAKLIIFNFFTNILTQLFQITANNLRTYSQDFSLYLYMDISKRDIVTQKLNNIPQHLMDEVIKYLDFLQYKSNTEDIELEKALNKALEDVENNKITPHNEVMASLKDRFSD